MYYRSRYTLCEHRRDGHGILVNTLTGAVDVVPPELVDFVREHPKAEFNIQHATYRTLLERGYYNDSADVEDAVAKQLGVRAKFQALKWGQPKYMFGLTLKCNLACSYCWQVQEHGESRQKSALMGPEQVSAAFAFIEKDLVARHRKDAVISLFGGEPLLDAPLNRRLVNLIGEETLSRGMHLHFTTNGKSLTRFRSEITKYRPSIQVTVDGANFENSSPLLMRAGQALSGVLGELGEVASECSASIFLRFLCNEDTVEQFVRLADYVFADSRFSRNFTLAVAPLQNKSSQVDPEIPPKFKILKRLVKALPDKSYTSMISFVDWRSLNLFQSMRAGEDALPEAGFYHCEANIDLTCFDQDGYLYACYEGIGKPEFAVGRYWPEVQVDAAHMAQYRDRSAFSIEQCSTCSLSPICGGGCEVRGYKKNGTYMLPYCDSLHAEVSQTLQHWPEISRMMTGSNVFA